MSKKADDSEESDSDGADGLHHDDDEEPDDMINAHFEKVQRTKNKFRCTLNDVMVHIKGKDFILSKLYADIQY